MMLFWDKYFDSWFISLFQFHSISYSVSSPTVLSHQGSTDSPPILKSVGFPKSADWYVFSVRRDLCNWTKAMQLRYNVSQIEEFLSRRNMREGPIIKELNPLVQSSQLMQVKKQDENDAKLLLQMCDSLTGAQVRPTSSNLRATLVIIF